MQLENLYYSSHFMFNVLQKMLTGLETNAGLAHIPNIDSF